MSKSHLPFFFASLLLLVSLLSVPGRAGASLRQEAVLTTAQSELDLMRRSETFLYAAEQEETVILTVPEGKSLLLKEIRTRLNRGELWLSSKDGVEVRLPLTQAVGNGAQQSIPEYNIRMVAGDRIILQQGAREFSSGYLTGIWLD